MVERTMPGAEIPDWVPIEARRYLAHTEAGQSIRTLARAAGVHASTVLRQIRRIESRRDDPLVDLALSALAGAFDPGGPERETDRSTQNADLSQSGIQCAQLGDTAGFQREACRVLRRLCESGAVLAVAEKMEKAVVVRDSDTQGAGARTAVVTREIAQAMALQDWISCSTPGAASRRINRYRITA